MEIDPLEVSILATFVYGLACLVSGIALYAKMRARGIAAALGLWLILSVALMAFNQIYIARWIALPLIIAFLLVLASLLVTWPAQLPRLGHKPSSRTV